MQNEINLSFLTFKPIYKEKVWGGQNLKTKLNKNIPINTTIGESWEISAILGNESVATQGTYTNETIPTILLKEKSKLVGKNIDTTEFPLLYKFIDAHDQLSIQVHPDDAQAQTKNMGKYGKTECWYIVDTKPGAQVICGFKNSVTKEIIDAAIINDKLQDICNYIPIAAGDVVFVPAGTIHATLAGTLLYEVQQTSDTTFRFYDWGRLDDKGNPRELHVADAMSVLDMSYHDRHKITPLVVNNDGSLYHAIRVVCRYFALEEYKFFDSMKLTLPVKQSFQVITVLDGSISISSASSVLDIAKGESILIPACLPASEIQTQAKTHLLVSYIPDIANEIVQPLLEKGFSREAIELLGGNRLKNDIVELL